MEIQINHSKCHNFQCATLHNSLIQKKSVKHTRPHLNTVHAHKGVLGCVSTSRAKAGIYDHKQQGEKIHTSIKLL